ncbi:MAG: substrate-binding domain-containing protein [Arcobacteraceae bacterium]|jgi:ribose transport system substrate-binding protein|nr:substrate-binding domain-containing protein [Arcobacteraceae bacterium]
MYILKYIFTIVSIGFLSFIQAGEIKKVVYIVSDTSIPFWKIMENGVKENGLQLGYKIDVYNSNNNRKTELEATVKAIKEKVSGIIISPTSSSSCVTILKLATKAHIPVVISDIGTDSGEYISYISSNNNEGAYNLGKILVQKMIALNIKNGKVGIIAIPQTRINGQARTTGFLKALNEASIKSVGIKQQITFSYQETYNYTKEFIIKNPDLKAIWLQGSDKYEGALNAINDAGKKDKILLVSFDAEPIFLDLISKDILVGAAMQQPYLMGAKAITTLNKYLSGEKVEKNIQLPILAISKENIKQNLPIIQKYVFGITK